MTDIFTNLKRHEIMSKIKGKDTKNEIRVRKWLYANGIRYRKNYKELPGKPDIAVTRLKTAIFVNGCFWHGHNGCKLYTIPKTRTEFWVDKINKTQKRDIENKIKLEGLGWKVFVLWECDLDRDFENTMKKLLNNLR